MKRNIKELLGKYIDNRINTKERRILKRLVSHLEDAEFANILSEIYEEYDNKAVNPVDFETLTEKLYIAGHKNRIIPFIAKIAASILIPVLTVSSIYFYNNNRKLDTFLNKEITVTVKSGDKSSLFLPDGTEVFLNSATTLTYPSNFGFNKREIYVEGETYLKVFKNPASPFRVNTDRLQIEVLGTEFNLVSYNNIIETTLVEGSIKLTTKGLNPQTVILSPHEKAVYDKSSDLLTIQETSTYFETAWLHGELIFRSANFATIMEKLQLRYGITIEIAGNKYDPDLFTGSFKESSVHEVLKTLRLHYDFTYTVETDNKIRIRFH